MADASQKNRHSTYCIWFQPSSMFTEITKLFLDIFSASNYTISSEVQEFVAYINYTVNNASSTRVLSTMESVMASYVFAATIVSTIGNYFVNRID